MENFSRGSLPVTGKNVTPDLRNVRAVVGRPRVGLGTYGAVVRATMRVKGSARHWVNSSVLYQFVDRINFRSNVQ